MPRAGRYDRLITIQQRTTTADSNYGTNVITWSTLGTGQVWASIEEMMPNRDEALDSLGGVEVSRDRIKVTIRYRSDVTSAMRVVTHDETDKTYNIVIGPTMIGRREELQFICERYSS